MRTVVLALAVGGAGCSAVTMPTERTVRVTSRSCTTSRVAPVVDTVPAVAGGLAAGLGLGILAVVAVGGSDDDSEARAVGYAVGAVFAVPGLIVGIPYGLSARHGFRSARACARRGRP